MLTEYEWRKQASRKLHRNPSFFGAQCVLTTSRGRQLMQDKAFRVFLLLLSCCIALLLPVFFPMEQMESFSDVSSVREQLLQPRQLSALSYCLPGELSYQQHIFTRSDLLCGNLMLIDAEHPLPPDVPPPNTVSIAVYGKGKVPVQNLQLKSGKETIDHLSALFSNLQDKHATGLMVCNATRSRAEQYAWLEEQVRLMMRSHSPEHAVEQVLQTTDLPGTGELQQEYTVEIRPANEQNSRTWQELTQTAWKFGFVRTMCNDSERSTYRFRWVGKAHATAMTYLDLSFKEYLEWLHEKKCIAVKENGEIRYLILCQPAAGTHTAFMLPDNADCEVSFDNMGYAVAACTFPSKKPSVD